MATAIVFEYSSYSSSSFTSSFNKEREEEEERKEKVWRRICDEFWIKKNAFSRFWTFSLSRERKKEREREREKIGDIFPLSKEREGEETR